MRILNAYSGIGGNRKLWTNCEVTAVEHNEEIADLYREYFPNDTVVVGDAHQYLLDHYKDFDFIWTSPPCQTHSKMRAMGVRSGWHDPKYIDMNLWKEIIFLQSFSKCRFVVENVESYYDPIIKPTCNMQRHYFWSNFAIPQVDIKETEIMIRHVSANDTVFGFSLKGRKLKHRKDQILRNCVNPDLGLYILDQARNIQRQEKSFQPSLFDM